MPPVDLPRRRGMGERMSENSSTVRAVAVLDKAGLWSGMIVGWLIVPMVMSLVYEVISRYVFNAPTIWAYDMTFMTYGSFFMLGSAYTLMRGGHIRTDSFYGSWSPQTQGKVDALCYVLFFFPAMLLFLWVTWDYFWSSFRQNERSVTSPWLPLLWPLKATMPITCVLLLLQGCAELLRSIHAAKTGVWIPRPHPLPALAAAEEKPSA
jgi:TRAP-type mannitol/chloroaromatic compound transport system permease small subunit